MKKHFSFLSLFLCICLPLFACAQDKTDKGGEKKDVPKIKFPVLKDYSLNLEIVSPEREFYAEEPVALSFKLENKDTRKIIVYEWMMKEGDNIVVYYKPYDGNYTKFVETEWKCVRPKVSENPKRSALQLNQNNSVFIAKEIDLSKEVMQAELAKGGKKFYVMGALNLSSLSLKSQPVVIKIK